MVNNTTKISCRINAAVTTKNDCKDISTDHQNNIHKNIARIPNINTSHSTNEWREHICIHNTGQKLQYIKLKENDLNHHKLYKKIHGKN